VRNRLKGAVFTVLESMEPTAARIWVGFFISPWDAVIIDHTLERKQKPGRKVTIEFPDLKRRMMLVIKRRNKELDLAHLQVQERSKEAPKFFKLYEGPSEDLVEKRLVLCSF
jgi:hypothetical protein